MTVTVAKPIAIESVWDYYPAFTEVISVNAVGQNGFNTSETYRLEIFRDSLWINVALDSLTGVSYDKIVTDDVNCQIQNVMLRSSEPLIPGVYRAIRIGETYRLYGNRLGNGYRHSVANFSHVNGSRNIFPTPCTGYNK